MCIMEVRPGQRTATIAQAEAHNINTNRGDIDLLRPLLAARGDHESLALVEEASQALDTAYAAFLKVYAKTLQHEVESGHDHPHADEMVGSERKLPAPDQEMIESVAIPLRAAAKLAAQRARRYETR
jgi:hypothetical protein